MKSYQHVLLCFLICCFCAFKASSQDAVKGVWKELGEKILASFDIEKASYDDGCIGSHCMLEFVDADKADVLLSINFFENEVDTLGELRYELRRGITFAGRQNIEDFRKDRDAKLPWWDESFYLNSKNALNSMLLLRKENTLIKIIADRSDHLFKIEKILSENGETLLKAHERGDNEPE